MVFTLPNAYFLVSGKGEGNTSLNAFDHAIMNAGVGNTNLIRLSSILPPNAKKINPISLPYGALVPIAYSFFSTIGNKVISASLSVGIPKDITKPGLIMETSGFDIKKNMELKAIEMAKDGFHFRGEKLENIESISIEYENTNSTKDKFICVFCGIVLWVIL